MKVSKILSHFFAITIFIGVLNGYNANANPLCDTQRFSGPFLISQKLVVREVVDYKFEILQQQNNINDLYRK